MDFKELKKHTAIYLEKLEKASADVKFSDPDKDGDIDEVAIDMDGDGKPDMKFKTHDEKKEHKKKKKVKTSKKLKKMMKDKAKTHMSAKEMKMKGGMLLKKFLSKNSVKKAALKKKYMGFDKLVEKLRQKGAKNPEAVAAKIGRKKYGEKRYDKMIQAGKPGGKKGKPAPGAMKKTELEKKQGVPKAADPATFERCVKDVKAKGKDKSSAYAICNAVKAGQKDKK